MRALDLLDIPGLKIPIRIPIPSGTDLPNSISGLRTMELPSLLEKWLLLNEALLKVDLG